MVEYGQNWPLEPLRASESVSIIFCGRSYPGHVIEGDVCKLASLRPCFYLCLVTAGSVEKKSDGQGIPLPPEKSANTL